MLPIPFNLVLPGFDRFISHASQTEYRVGEDMGLGIRNLKKLLSHSKLVALHVCSLQSVVVRLLFSF